MLVERPSNHDGSLHQERLPMNRARSTIIRIIFLSATMAAFANIRGAFAGSTDAPNAQSGATAKPPAKDPKAGASKAADDKEKFGPRIAQRITKINKLRQMMEE